MKGIALFETISPNNLERILTFQMEAGVSLPLDYSLFLSFFNVTPKLYQWNLETGEYENNPDRLTIGFNVDKNVFFNFVDLSEADQLSVALFNFKDQFDIYAILRIGSITIPSGGLFIDLSEAQKGSIYYITWEFLDSPDGWIKLANSFDEFISKLSAVKPGDDTVYLTFSR